MKLRQGLIVLSVLLAGTVASRAAGVTSPILITIDDSNPSAVTFTFTSADPSASNSGYIFNDGIELETFFTSAQSEGNSAISSSTLTTSIDGSPFYNEYQADNASGPDNVDLNIYTGDEASEFNTESFSTSSQAFTGTATIDLSGYTGLPTEGATGVLAAGFGEETVTPIGYWEVTNTAAVPEPSQWGGLAVLGVIGFVFARRSRLIKI